MFPRDGTSRCPFVPGQKKILVPVSLCPGTRAGANVPGQSPLSRPVPGQNNLPKRTKKQEKDVPKQEKDIPKQEKDVLKQEKDVLKQKNDVLKREIWSLFLKIFKSFCPGTGRDRGVCPGTFAPALVPGQRDTGTRIFFCPGTTGQWDVACK